MTAPRERWWLFRPALAFPSPSSTIHRPRRRLDFRIVLSEEGESNAHDES